MKPDNGHRRLLHARRERPRRRRAAEKGDELAAFQLVELRDAELRAARVVADNIRSRLASYFISVT